MNSLLQAPIIKNEKRWYFLSVFYAREKWDELIIDIMNFYRTHSSLFSTYLFSFSSEYGEHLQITFASSDVNNDYTSEIQTHFQMFVDRFPSNSTIQFPYGKAIWGNYPNNSLAWNRFRLPFYSDEYIRLHQQTMRVALNLMEDDFSEETIFSVGMYLFVKGLSCIGSKKEQKNTLSQILKEVSADNTNNKDTIKKLITKMDIDEVRETIVSYRNEDVSEYSLELIIWMDEVDILLKNFEYNRLCLFISKILGLNRARQIMIMELLYKFM